MSIGCAGLKVLSRCVPGPRHCGGPPSAMMPAPTPRTLRCWRFFPDRIWTMSGSGLLARGRDRGGLIAAQHSDDTGGGLFKPCPRKGNRCSKGRGLAPPLNTTFVQCVFPAFCCMLRPDHILPAPLPRFRVVVAHGPSRPPNRGIHSLIANPHPTRLTDAPPPSPMSPRVFHADPLPAGLRAHMSATVPTTAIWC